MGIQFWHGLQKGPVLDEFLNIVKIWNDDHPNAQVTLRHSSDYAQLAKEALDLPQDQQPSLVLAPEYMTGRMLSASIGDGRKVIPIDEMIEPSLLAKVALIVKKTFGDKEGNLVSLPFNPACGVLYINRNLLRALGKDPHFAPQSIEKLEEVSTELIKAGLVPHGYTCAWPAAYLVEVPAATQDLPLVLPSNGSEGVGVYQLSQSWLIDHFRHLREEVRSKVFVYSGQDNNAKIPFLQRQVAFFMQGSSHFASLQDDAKKAVLPFELDAAPLPTLTHHQTSSFAFPLGGASIWVMNNPQTEKMVGSVRAFLNYLASEPTQVRWHKATASVPVLETTKDSLQEYYLSHPVHRAVIAQTVDSVLGQYSFGIKMPNYAQARKELFTLIEQLLDVGKTPDDQIEPLLKAFDMKWSTPKT